MDVFTVIAFGPDGITYSHMPTWDSALDAASTLPENTEWKIVVGTRDEHGTVHPERVILHGC